MITITCQEKRFPNIQAIIFDKDGTLEDSQPFLRELTLKRTRLLDAQIPGIGEPLLMAFGMQNHQLNPAGLMAVGSRQANEIAAAAYIAETGRGWFEALEIAQKAFQEADEYISRNQTNSPIFSDGIKLIQNLVTTDLKLGIISSDATTNIKTFLAEHHLSSYFDIIVGTPCQWSKPDPRLYYYTCQQLDVNPQNTLMIGDALGDIIMAKDANASGVIAINRGNSLQSNLEKADIIINNLERINYE